MVPMLNNLAYILKKAEKWAADNKVEATKLTESRLAPDMLPFPRQIQICTDISKAVLARVLGLEVPKWEDNETTFPELHARLEKAIALLKTVDEKAFEGKDNAPVKFSVGGKDFDLTGLTYMQSFALPNFFFHVVTAYDLLRQNGVPLGKAEYLAGGRQVL